MGSPYLIKAGLSESAPGSKGSRSGSFTFVVLIRTRIERQSLGLAPTYPLGLVCLAHLPHLTSRKSVKFRPAHLPFSSRRKKDLHFSRWIHLSCPLRQSNLYRPFDYDGDVTADDAKEVLCKFVGLH